MSDLARHWSRSIRGVNFAEHAVLRELAEYHALETNLCFPNLQTICGIFECSRPYLKQILCRLEVWRFFTRVEWFEQEKDRRGRIVRRQTSNRFNLHFDRHFPAPVPEGRKVKDKNTKQKAAPYDRRDNEALWGSEQGLKLLRLTRAFLKYDETLAEGVKEAFLQRGPVSAAAGLPPGSRLWIGLESETHERRLISTLPDLGSYLRRETKQAFEIELLPLFFRNPKKKT